MGRDTEKYNTYQREYRSQSRVKQKISQYNKKQHQKRWSSMTPEEKREWNSKKIYGLLFEDMQKIYEEQEKKCACCQIKFLLKDLVVDHCHNSNVVRGLLCSSCNKSLGFARDDVSTLKNMILYLEKQNGR